MKQPAALIPLLLVMSAACSAPRTASSPQAVAVIETPVFPPVWTPTALELQPSPNSENGTPKPDKQESATITPTDTATWTSIPKVTFLPSTTPELSRIRCTMSTDVEGVELYKAPYFSDYRILPTMEPGYAYQAAETFPTMVRLSKDGQTAGWVDYRILAVSLDGPGCLDFQYSGGLTDFMDYLCFIAADPPADAYMDPDYSEPAGMKIGPEPRYVVTTLASDGPRGFCVGHAGPCFHVDPSTVDTVGNCTDLPRSAETTTDTRLWSQPDGNAGLVIRELPAGQFVAVQYGEDISGPPPPGASVTGTWLQVKLSGSKLPRTGWVWSAYVKYR